MPEAACLHIQAGESDPVRVVDLPGGSARIGRAAYCDVRLPEPEVADEECRLRRRGDSWQLVPVGPTSGAVWLDGRPLDRPQPIPFDVPFRVGDHWLTLRSSAAAAGSWNTSPAAQAPVVESGADGSPPPSPAGTDLASRHRAEWQNRSGQHDRWLETHRETKRWESRWRAAATSLRTTPTTATPAPKPPPRPEHPPAEERARRAELLRGTFARREELRPAKPPAPAEEPVQPGSVPDSNPPPDAAEVVAPELITPELIATDAAALPAEPASVECLAEPETVPPEPEVESPVEPVNALAVIETDRGEPRSASGILDEPLDDAWLSAAAAIFDAQPPPRRRVEPVVPTASVVEPAEVVHEVAPATDSTRSEVVEDEDDPEPDDDPDRPRLGAAHQVAAPDPDRPMPDEAAAGVSPPVAETPQKGPPPRPGRRGFSSRRGVHRKGREPEKTGSGPASHDAGLTPVGFSTDPGWSYPTPFVMDTTLGPVSSGHERRPAGRPDVAPVCKGPGSAEQLGSTDGPSPHRTGLREPGASPSPRDWPSVSDILAAQVGRPQPAKPERGTKPRAVRRPLPTVAREPGHWRFPLWLGWLPAATAAVGVGVVGLAGAWVWSLDAYNAGVVARRLAANEPRVKPLPEGVVPTDGPWWKTDARNLVTWAAYLDRTGDDPAQAEDAVALLGRAAEASPLNPTVRYARARPMPGEPSAAKPPLASVLGQSRDVLTLTSAGSRLLAEGKKDAALEAYRAALTMAAQADLSRPGVPAFLDDPDVRRYALPAEDLLAAVIGEMAASKAWAFKDWADALPRGTAAPVVAARVLRESGSSDAGPALDAALADVDAVPGASAGRNRPADEALRMAAGAAALGMKHRYADARDRYTRAIDLMPVDPVRRSWWLNVAYLSLRLNEEPERLKALENAKNADPKDEITRRVVAIQKESGVVAQRPGVRGLGPAAARP